MFLLLFSLMKTSVFCQPESKSLWAWLDQLLGVNIYLMLSTGVYKKCTPVLQNGTPSWAGHINPHEDTTIAPSCVSNLPASLRYMQSRSTKVRITVKQPCLDPWPWKQLQLACLGTNKKLWGRKQTASVMKQVRILLREKMSAKAVRGGNFCAGLFTFLEKKKENWLLWTAELHSDSFTRWQIDNSLAQSQLVNKQTDQQQISPVFLLLFLKLE